MKWNNTLLQFFKNQKRNIQGGVVNDVSKICTNSTKGKNESLQKERKEKQKLKNGYILSVDEALYLSKEMGIKTTSELQRIIMRSPPFSADTSPFVIENFFRNSKTEKTYKSTEELLNIEKQIETLENEKEQTGKIEQEEAEQNSIYNTNDNDDIVSKILVKSFNKNKTRKFIHDGKEWLEESEGIGTNKRSCAYVYLKRGSGIIKINNEEDFYIRWPYFYNRIDVIEPFHLTNTACVYNVFIKLKGGGVSGQARAARLAIGRALLNACPSVQNILLENDILYEDIRQKMPKMPGRRKARAMKQWSKR